VTARVRLASDLSLEIDCEASGIETIIDRLSWDSARTSDVAGRVRIRPDPRAARIHLRVGDPAKGISWRDDCSGAVELNGGLASVELDDRGTLSAELGVDPDNAFEPTLRMVRLAAELVLAVRGSAVLHAASVVVDGRAWLLMGESGAGKTTTARRLGREGAFRIADDTVLFRFADQTVEPFVLDRGGWLPGRRGARWPLAGALAVEKGADTTGLAGPVGHPLRTWLAAVFAPSLPPRPRLALMEALGRQAQRSAPVRFQVAPSGPILDVLRAPSVVERG